MAKRSDPQVRRRILEQWKRSGLSSHDFARRAGVSYSTLYKWRREVSAPSRFVEIVPRRAASSAQPEENGLAPALEIMLPAGVVVRVGRDVDEAMLRRVVRALA